MNRGLAGKISGVKVWLALLGLFVFSACASQTTETPLPVKAEVLKSLNRYKKEFVLAPGDIIEVVVFRTENLTRTVTIRQDGFISLPILDDVKAAGLSVKELDDVLTRGFSERLVDPEVTIIVTNPHEPMVFIVGEVAAPNVVPLRQARTAAHAIAQVGGMARTASKDQVAVIRLEGDGHIRAHVVENHDSGQPAYYMALQSFELQADDLVFIPENKRSQFTRFVDDFINTPLGGLNQALTPYFQFKLISEISN